MWTRERWLTVRVRRGGYGVAVGTYAVAGGLASLAVGLLAAGAELIYLANAYAVPGAKPDA